MEKREVGWHLSGSIVLETNWKRRGAGEKEINGKNLLLIAMMKKLEAFVEAGGFWLYEDLCLQSKEVSLPLEIVSPGKKCKHTTHGLDSPSQLIALAMGVIYSSSIYEDFSFS